MTVKTAKEEHRYGIGAVAKLTGLTDHTIRVWERRYDAVVAERAPNGRRVYNPADVEKLGLLKRLTDQGLSISQIAANSVDELRERAESLNEFVSVPVPDHIGVAILGDFLPGQFDVHEHAVEPVDILVADNNRDRFVADISQQRIDVIVVESPVLDSDVIGQLREYMRHAGAAKGVIVYSFGRVRDVDTARGAHIVALRSPANVDEVCAAILRVYTPGKSVRRRKAPTPDSSSAEWDFAAKVAPRRFSNRQLMTLAQASTTIDCECPHHLAQLVGDLTAFEVYSANCASRDEEDAALHRYLHQTTAQARALIEVALEKVAVAEGIKY